ncbi:hypothetical protein Tco_0358743 [Tanacetum coccineum]
MFKPPQALSDSCRRGSFFDNQVKTSKMVFKFLQETDKFDKETGSSDGMQPKQADLSCVHALNESHLYEIHVVPNKHEADQCFAPLRRESIQKLCIHLKLFQFHVVDVHVIE